MKTAFVAAAITTLASVASAQGGFNVNDLPECSLQCFLTTLGGDGCSSLLDYECHCKKSGLTETITPCVQKACEAKDQATVASAVVGLCSQYGVSLSVPNIESTAAPASSAATSAAASATEAASSAASSVASSVGSVVSSAASSAASSASEDASSGAAASTASTASATDLVVSGTPSSSAGASTPAPTTPSTPGAATPTASSFEGAAARGGTVAGVLGFGVAIAAFAGL